MVCPSCGRKIPNNIRYTNHRRELDGEVICRRCATTKDEDVAREALHLKRRMRYED